MNAHSTFPTSRQAEQEAQSIVSICEREIERRRERPDLYGRQCILDLLDIKWAATAVIDHLAGNEGFEHAPAELDALLTDWAENVDYRTFPETPALDALDGDRVMGPVWCFLRREGESLLREGRNQLDGRP